MKKRKLIISFLILSLVFFWGIIGLFITMSSIDKQTEKNTTEFMGTVTNVEIADTGKNIYVAIHTEEYGDTLHISTSVSEKIDMDDINNLQIGQTILFRIENNMLERFEETGFGNIVSLGTVEKEIFSLTSYNTYIRDSAFPAKIAGIVVASIFLLTSIHCVLLLKGVNIFRKFK